MNDKEQVLVCRGELVEPYTDLFLKGGGFLGMDRAFVDSVTSEEPFFVEREKAESDPSYKQVIPYCIITSPAGVYAYQRTTGAEKRLSDKWSIGVGGHINPVDTELSLGGDDSIYSGLYRELSEELGLDATELPGSPLFIGFIYDPSNEVGRVHLGFVFHLNLPDVGLLNSTTHARFDWLCDIVALKIHNKLENWSKILVDNWSRFNA